MKAFYNDNDPFAVKWLENLIADGLITEGVVDGRGVEEITGKDLQGFERVHLFAGIGGWDYALQLAGWEGPVWTMSCPCQPYSCAGRGRGAEDPRNLWPQGRRLVAESRPPTVFGEQVASRAGREWLAGVRADLEDLGYKVGAADLCAAGIGAPHIRSRLWWVAHSDGSGQERRPVDGQKIQRSRRKGEFSPDNESETTVSCEDGGMENARRAVEERRAKNTHDEPRERPSGLSRRTSNNGWMDDSRGEGSQRHPGDETDGEKSRRDDQKSGRSTSSSGSWNRCLLISCGDGKSRRVPVESSFFPMAPGLPGRVGLLRGAGNSIVPQVAAEFIQACKEAISRRHE